jgi:purine-binding chemotaxis protein CheW
MPENITGQIVIFSLGGEEYALPIDSVHEIIRYTKPRSVASDDPSVQGVISLRGKILPVYDLATRLGHTTQRSEDAKIVIVHTPDDTTAGVVVDDVEEVHTIDSAQIDDAPVDGDGIHGIARIDDRLVVLLDPARVVSRDGTGAAASI